MPAPKRQTKNKQDEKVLNLVDAKQKKERQAKPADNPEAREKQLVNLAVDLAEQQLRDGTASAAVMTHFLKIGSNREKLEREILEKQSEYLTAKASNIAQAKDAENLAKEAVEAMRSYNSSSN